MKINSVKKIKSLKNKTVFLRVDFNVPMDGKKILSQDRIIEGLETINFLNHQKAKIVIAAHLGEPTAGPDKNYSLRPIAARLQKLLKKPVIFLPDCLGEKVLLQINKLKPGEIIMLENLRFHQEEYDNDSKFAKSLADLADIYVNEAFSVSHRNQASMSAIKKYLPAYAGIHLEQELLAFNKVLKPVKPSVVIMGGSKLSTKIPLILKLYKKVDYILIGGALANNFFKIQNLEIGQSVIEKINDPFAKKDLDKTIRTLFKGQNLLPKILLPIDVVVKTKNGQARLCRLDQVKKQESILDIGPETINKYASIIKLARTLVWNGPMGKFEEKSFKHGTIAIATLIAARSSGRAYGVVGGGETIEALKLTKMTEYVDWISTAGGAMLAYLGGGKMPGLSKIIS